MLFKREFLDGIQDGRITVAFRRWRRPSVRAGGTLMTAAGQLSIRSVTEITQSKISSADARRAGYKSRELLLKDLNQRAHGQIYRIELGSLRPDPRIPLRQAPVADDEGIQAILKRLDRLDAHAAGASWTHQTLEVLDSHPAVRAGDLCVLVGQEKAQFKVNVRKLKNLGLTESLDVGYRLSPRGHSVLEHVREHQDGPLLAPWRGRRSN